MSATRTKKPAPKKKDRHLTPVVVFADGTMLAGKRRIEAFQSKHPDARVAVRAFWHYAMLAFLRVARDEEGHLHLATSTVIDQEGWEELT